MNSAWTSKNSNNVGNRSVSAAVYNSKYFRSRTRIKTDMLLVSVQVGNVASNFIYRADDAPLYRRGNRNLVIVNVLVIMFFLFTKAYYVLRNKYQDRKWNAMTQEARPFTQRLYGIKQMLTVNRSTLIIFLKVKIWGVSDWIFDSPTKTRFADKKLNKT